MNAFSEKHPLLIELKRGELWHATSPEAFTRILADNEIRPFKGPNKRDRRPAASQYLGGVSLFDWTHPEWADGITKGGLDFFRLGIAIGFNKAKVPGKLIWYPDTRDLTSEDVTHKDICGPFPYVEVIHIGPIPLSAATRVLVICPKALELFKSFAPDDREAQNAEIDIMRLFAEGRKAYQ